MALYKFATFRMTLGSTDLPQQALLEEGDHLLEEGDQKLSLKILIWDNNNNNQYTASKNKLTNKQTNPDSF